jgi:acetyl-CoA carboxylase biotin carboxylase subunit
MFKRVLIANRGEIALRIIRACKELGVETVCVYSTADKDAPYLRMADRAICIGPGPAKESYLNISRLISAAEIADVDAIHPGYGFLSERPDFSMACRDCKIEFIGPSPEAMGKLGDKVECKNTAKANKVPVFPGSDGAIEEEEEAVAVAAKIGYPVIIKASAGGGGRGMRVCRNEATLRPRSRRPSRRPRPPSATARSSSRSSSSTRATSRSSAWATSTATPSTFSSATAPCSAVTRRSSRKPEPERRPRKIAEKVAEGAARLLKASNYAAPRPSSSSWTRSRTSTCSR